MNKKYIIISSLIAFAVLLITTTVADATFDKNRDNWRENLTSEQKQEMQEKRTEMREKMEARRIEMQEIIDSGDYETWKAEIEKRQAERFNILDVINEDNFDKLVEMHNLKQVGDMEGAKVLAEELGLPGIGHGKMMRGMNKGMKMGHFKFNQSKE